MNRMTAAALIALAFTAGNIAAPSAQSLRLKSTNGPTAAPTIAPTITSKPFVAKCVSGFQKYGEQKATKAGVPVVQQFGCRTAWIECPDLAAYDQTWTEYEIEDQPTGNEGKRIRFKYVCKGVDIAG